jgi:hypothetical protein
MAEIVPGRVISGAREISRDTLMERAACAATGLGNAIGIVLCNDFAVFEAIYAAQRLSVYSVSVNWHGKNPGDRLLCRTTAAPRGDQPKHSLNRPVFRVGCAVRQKPRYFLPSMGLRPRATAVRAPLRPRRLQLRLP